MPFYLILALLTILIGAYGTLIGSGGGFALVPLLLVLYPNDGPEAITAVSLSVTLVGAIAASAAYGKLKRIDYRSGILLSIATVPGAVLGALTTYWTGRRLFNALFGAILIVEAIYLLKRRVERRSGAGKGTGRATSGTTLFGYPYPFDWRIGALMSFLVGYISSLLGIGGGIIFVPVLVRMLGMPVKIAAATSLFIIILRSLSGVATHITMGALHGNLPRIAFLSVGIVVGARIGVSLSTRIRSRWIFRGLALALVAVGAKLIVAAFL